MCPLGHDAGNQSNVLQIQFMRQALDRNRLNKRIGNDNLLGAGRRRIAVERRLHIRLQDFTHPRQIAEKFDRQGTRGGRGLTLGHAGRRKIFQAFAEFILEISEHGIHQCRRHHFDFRRMNGVFVKKSGEKHSQQILGDGGDGTFGRQILSVQMVDAAHFGVRGDQLIG